MIKPILFNTEVEFGNTNINGHHQYTCPKRRREYSCGLLMLGWRGCRILPKNKQKQNKKISCSKMNRICDTDVINVLYVI